MASKTREMEETALSLKDALAGVDEYLESVHASIPGQVQGVPDDPKCKVGRRPDFHYYWFDAAELSPGRAQKLRDTLRRRQFWPVDPESGAYVESCSTAEIWATHWEVKDRLFAARKAKADKARAALRPRRVYSQQ
jgi:hypothetical protein